MSTSNPHHGQNAAVLLSGTYVFAAFGGHWPNVAFLILALITMLAGSPSGPPYPPHFRLMRRRLCALRFLTIGRLCRLVQMLIVKLNGKITASSAYISWRNPYHEVGFLWSTF